MDKILINKHGAKSVDDFLKIRDQKLPMENMIRKILKDKTPRYTEIEISFFELCALHCRFCWQDNYNPTGTNTIAEKAEIVVDYLKKQEAILQPNIQVHLLGGELFEDSNDYYGEYTAFINRIFEHCQLVLPDKELMFVFLTNMNFQKDETKAKLESFLNGLRSKGVKFILTTSWDPTGRPLKGDIETQFHKNITHFKDDLSEVTFVLTKPTIKKLLEDKNEYLSLLVEQGFNIDYDYYMPTTWADSLMPSDRDLLNAFRYLIYKFPGIRKLKSWLEPEEEACRITCASLNTSSGSIPNSLHILSLFQFLFFNSIIMSDIESTL
jgi:hypothetical protein